ncbi:MAG: S9 family peptidase [Chloroflexi bacterium]|nr:S9 family peptidase [Chloroflexota bacterium]
MIKELQIQDAALWKQRFRAPEILASQIARGAPDRGLVVTNQDGVYQLYTWDVPTGQLTQITDRPEGEMVGFLAPDGRHVYYLDDEQGNEIGHLVRIPYQGGEPESITPDLPPYSRAGFAISDAGNFIGFTAGTLDGLRLYVIDLGPEGAIGSLRMLHHSKPLMFGPILSYGGEIALMQSTARSAKFQFSLLAFDTNSGEQIAELYDGEESSLQPIRFSPLPDDVRLLATTNRTGIETLLLWNPLTGERTDLIFDDVKGALTGCDWSPDGKRILFSASHKAVQQLYMYDLPSSTLVKLDHPSGCPSSGFTGPYFGPQDDIYAHFQDSTRPIQVLALDGQTGAKKHVVLEAGEVPDGRPWKSITFNSSDGQEIQGWLAVPEGDGPFPTIFETHGGPSAVAEESFSPRSQAWLDHGFAYLTINFRGSTTFGREFQDKIMGNLGHWEVEDMVAARDWLVREGISKADEILLTGWSYGGYLTLLALGKRPDLWAGGMAGIAIADWAVQYDYSSQALRGYQVSLFGGTPKEMPDAYAASSPITYAENVSAPVIIIQGRNDTRTPALPIEMYEEKFKALGKDIQVHWFDAGHMGAFAQTEQGIAHQELLLRFAYRVLNK